MSEKYRNIDGPFDLKHIDAYAVKSWFYRETGGLTICIETQDHHVGITKISLSKIQNYLKVLATWNRRAKRGKRA